MYYFHDSPNTAPHERIQTHSKYDGTRQQHSKAAQPHSTAASHECVPYRVSSVVYMSVEVYMTAPLFRLHREGETHPLCTNNNSNTTTVRHSPLSGALEFVTSLCRELTVDRRNDPGNKSFQGLVIPSASSIVVKIISIVEEDAAGGVFTLTREKHSHSPPAFVSANACVLHILACPARPCSQANFVFEC